MASFFFKWLSRFEFSEGKLTTIASIMEHSKEIKENVHFGAPLQIISLAYSWKNSGPTRWSLFNQDHKKRVLSYLNLQKCLFQMYLEQLLQGINLQSSINNIQLPSGCMTICNHGNKVSTVGHKKCRFKNQWVTTKLPIIKSDLSQPNYIISPNGCKLDLEKHQTPKPLNGRFCHSLNILHCAKEFQTPEHSDGTTTTQSQFCVQLNNWWRLQQRRKKNILLQKKIISWSNKCRATCGHLGHVDARRKRRKSERPTIQPATNKHYMRKEEVLVQLHQQQQAWINAGNRAK